MTKFRSIVLAALAAILSSPAAFAQVPPTTKLCYNNGSVCTPVTAATPLPVSGTFSATLGGFAPSTTGTPIAVTTGGVTQALPAGTVVVATNVGTTNAAYCKLGVTATLNDQFISPNGGWFAYTVGANSQLTCITSTGTTTVNTSGGTGLPTGTGGGSGGGGGGGGAVTMASGAVASGAYSAGSIASGAMVDLGAIADAAATAGGTGTLSAKLRLMTTQLGTINTTLGTPFQAGGALGTGSNIIGRVGIDQTTPGTTNLVSIGTNGTVNPTTAANWGIGTATQNSASATNGQLALGQFNTTPTTITSGNMSPLQMDNAGNLLVNIKAGSSSGAVAQGSTTAGQTGGLMQAAVTTAAPTYTTAQTNPLSMTTAGNLRTTDAILNAAIGTTTDAVCTLPASGTACTLIGLTKAFANSSVTALPAQANTTTNIGNVGNIAIPNGGATGTGNIAANNTTAVVVKAGAGTLYGVQLAGLGSAPAYLKIYNATSATCGSGTPIKRLMIPAASTAANGAGSNITFGATGVNFSTGITYCVTTGIGDSDTTAPAASTFLVNLDWN